MVWKLADEPAPKKVKLEKTQKRVMCTTFSNHQGVIYIEYLLLERKGDHTMTKERYIETLYNLRTAIKCKHPGLLSSRVIILHDNARVHTTGITFPFLTNFGWIIFTHLPNSLDLAPSNYYLFPLVKTWLSAMVCERC